MTTNDQLIGQVKGAAAAGLLQRVARELGPQDIVVAAYVLLLNVAVWIAPPHPDRLSCSLQVLGLLVFLVFAVVTIRGGLLRHGVVAPLLYRLAIYGSVQTSYFVFRRFLPVVNPGSLDHELHALDLSLFGVEPAVYLDRFVTPLTTEWFSFFYYSYFFLLVVHAIPILFFVRHPRLLGEFTLGMLIVVCVGQALYMLVPGYGPYHAIPELFTREFPRGIWLDTVMAAVAQGGAQKDIFPSLHTAAPAFIALYSFRHRHVVPYRYTWPIVVFVSANIVVATMFLRWHWIIDVAAGLVLALIGMLAAAALTDREIARRRTLALAPSWPLFALRKTEPEPAGQDEDRLPRAA